jgi:hypothetical protein
VDEFNYLAVLISIILGLGITQLLSGLGRWIEQRSSFRAYGPAMCWAFILLLSHVQTWWSMFGMRDHREWTFLQFCIVLLQPILLFLLATVALPGAGSELDLRSNYFAQKNWFFGLLMMLLVTSIAKDLSLSGSLPSPLNLLFHGILFTVSLLAIVIRGETFHRAVAYSSTAVMVAYIALLFSRLE